MKPINLESLLRKFGRLIKITAITLLVGAGLASPSTSRGAGAVVTLRWDNRPEWITNALVGFNVYGASGVPGWRLFGVLPYTPVPVGNSFNFAVTNLSPGTYSFYVTASNSLESVPSNIATTNVPPPPVPPVPPIITIELKLQSSASPLGPWTNLVQITNQSPAISNGFYRAQLVATETPL